MGSKRLSAVIHAKRSVGYCGLQAVIRRGNPKGLLCGTNQAFAAAARMAAFEEPTRSETVVFVRAGNLEVLSLETYFRRRASSR